MKALYTTQIPAFPLFSRGKVRDMYDLGDHLLMVATDRISAFDCVLPTPIPDKGKILNQLSLFWFKATEHIVKNHILSPDPLAFADSLRDYESQLHGRAVVVRKATPIPIECVVRGYLAGSGWREYKQTSSICGIKLPSGLRESDKLPEPIFTPATKAKSGHDENITFQEACQLVGEETANKLRELSLALYKFAHDYAHERGIIIADTKFEFGMLGDEIILIDELLTPDSSRFWPLEEYEPGRSQASFDKQFVRDYLESLEWDKTPPAPPLPEHIISKTREKYIEAFTRLTGNQPQL